MQSDSVKDDLRNCGCGCDCDCNCGCNCVTVPSVSALNSVNVATQTVASQGLVLFNLNRVSVGCSINHTPSTGVFSLAGPGIYQVSFSAVVAIPALTPVTTIALVYNLDGRDIPGDRAVGYTVCNRRVAHCSDYEHNRSSKEHDFSAHDSKQRSQSG